MNQPQEYIDHNPNQESTSTRLTPRGKLVAKVLAGAGVVLAGYGAAGMLNNAVDQNNRQNYPTNEVSTPNLNEQNIGVNGEPLDQPTSVPASLPGPSELSTVTVPGQVPPTASGTITLPGGPR